MYALKLQYFRVEIFDSKIFWGQKSHRNRSFIGSKSKKLGLRVILCQWLSQTISRIVWGTGVRGSLQKEPVLPTPSLLQSVQSIFQFIWFLSELGMGRKQMCYIGTELDPWLIKSSQCKITYWEVVVALSFWALSPSDCDFRKYNNTKRLIYSSHQPDTIPQINKSCEINEIIYKYEWN